MAFKLLYGEACIRYQKAVDSPTSGSVNAINAGQAVEIAMDEEVVLQTTAARTIGIAMDDKNATSNECAASGKITIAMGEFVGKTDQLESGISWDANDPVYASSGNFTKVDPGSGRKCGIAMGPVGTDGFLEFYWNLAI